MKFDSLINLNHCFVSYHALQNETNDIRKNLIKSLSWQLWKFYFLPTHRIQFCISSITFVQRNVKILSHFKQKLSFISKNRSVRYRNPWTSRTSAFLRDRPLPRRRPRPRVRPPTTNQRPTDRPPTTTTKKKKKRDAVQVPTTHPFHQWNNWSKAPAWRGRLTRAVRRGWNGSLV